MSDWPYERFRRCLDEVSFVSSSAYVVDGIDLLRAQFESCFLRGIVSGFLNEDDSFTGLLEAMRDSTERVVLHGPDFFGRPMSDSEVACYSLHYVTADVDPRVYQVLPEDYREIFRRGYGGVSEAMADSEMGVAFVSCLRVLDDGEFLASLEEFYSQNGGKRLVSQAENRACYEDLTCCVGMVKERFGEIALLGDLRECFVQWEGAEKWAGMESQLSGRGGPNNS